MKERHKLQEEPETDPNVPQKAGALKYDLERDAAPRVVAKGRGHVAENILVNMLMALDIDREIPPELYRTIAEVMAYVYRIDKKAKPKTKPEAHR